VGDGEKGARRLYNRRHEKKLNFSFKAYLYFARPGRPVAENRWLMQPFNTVSKSQIASKTSVFGVSL
jgi:hypothetical protein